VTMSATKQKQVVVKLDPDEAKALRQAVYFAISNPTLLKTSGPEAHRAMVMAADKLSR
jgi:hypothetical protein